MANHEPNYRQQEEPIKYIALYLDEDEKVAGFAIISNTQLHTGYINYQHTELAVLKNIVREHKPQNIILEGKHETLVRNLLQYERLHYHVCSIEGALDYLFMNNQKAKENYILEIRKEWKLHDDAPAAVVGAVVIGMTMAALL